MLFWSQKWDHNRLMGQVVIDDHIGYRSNKAAGFISSSDRSKTVRKTSPVDIRRADVFEAAEIHQC